MSIGDGKQYVAQNLIMSASNDQGNAVLNNMGGRCQMNRLIDTVAKIVEAHGYCAYTGADNDQIFEADGRHRQIPRSARIIITSVPVKSTYDGTLQAVGHKNGTYKIVKTN